MRLIAAAFLALVMSSVAQAAAFTASEPLSSDTGQVLVEWEADAPVRLEIANADEPETVRPLYEGENTSFFLSGLADGDYVLTLADDAGGEGDEIALNVTQQSLAQALWLTLIGAIITLGIVATILRGARP